MKKITVFLTLLAIIAGMALTAFAAEPKLQISDASAKPGDTVYLTVSLTEAVTGDTMGITYTYDRTVLEVVSSACTWEQKGVLQDFGSYDDSGVWTSGKSQEISGDICVLTFRVKSDVNFTGTDVACTLLVKNGSEKVGEFTATARISATCEHVYGDWQDAGEVGHSRGCELCGGTQTASHDWDEGTRTPDPENSGLDILTRTCGVCGAVRTSQVPGEQEGQIPTVPEGTDPPVTEPPKNYMTEPTVPQNRPQNGQTQRPTEPQEPTQGNQNSGTSNDIVGNSQSQINNQNNSQNGGQSQGTDQNNSQNSGQSQGTAQNGQGQSQNGQTNRDPEDEHRHTGESGGSGENSSNQGTGSTEPVEGDFHVHIGENGEYIIHEGREHTEEESQTLPPGDDSAGEDHTGHEHAETGDRGAGAIAVVIAVLLLAGGAYWGLKKKKR